VLAAAISLMNLTDPVIQHLALHQISGESASDAEAKPCIDA
jgi:hypothetical protein